MSILVQSSLSREYIRVAISAKEFGVTVDPTSDTVAFAFKTTGEPASGDFVAGGWETDNGRFFARILVGPGGAVVLADDTYDIYIKLTDSPEVPVRKVGQVRIT